MEDKICVKLLCIPSTAVSGACRLPPHDSRPQQPLTPALGQRTSQLVVPSTPVVFAAARDLLTLPVSSSLEGQDLALLMPPSGRESLPGHRLVP